MSSVVLIGLEAPVSVAMTESLRALEFQPSDERGARVDAIDRKLAWFVARMESEEDVDRIHSLSTEIQSGRWDDVISLLGSAYVCVRFHFVTDGGCDANRLSAPSAADLFRLIGQDVEFGEPVREFRSTRYEVLRKA